jgi:cobalt-zinc-cadmium efflux system outer membrane protein
MLGSGINPVWASPKKSLKKVNEAVKVQTGVEGSINKEMSKEEIRKSTELLLDEPLTADSAVRIAVLNNASLKASIIGLGVSQADLMQGGLLHNPTFSASIRQSNEEDTKSNTDFEVKQDITDIIFWPLRKRLANSQFKQAEYELTEKIVDFIKEVKVGFYHWQANMHMLAMRQDHFKAEEAALELAQRQRNAGNISSLALEEQKAIYYQAEIDLQRSQLESEIAYQQLRNLLGLTDSELQWTSQKALPDLSMDDLSLEKLEEDALTNRIDLDMVRQEGVILKQSLTAARLGLIPSVEGGFNWEREANGEKVAGPVIEAEVPIFDHKQADRLRVNSQIEMNKKMLEALEAQTRLEVRSAFEQLNSNQKMVEAYLKALPVRKEIIKQTLYHYNYMLKGVYDLLRAKQEEAETRSDYIMALRDYWIARAELEHATGSSLPVVKQSKSEPKEKKEEPAMDHEHHHGGDK